MNTTNRVFAFSLAIMIGILFCMSIVYLRHTNMVATKGYEIKRLQLEDRKLQIELDDWNLRVVSKNSLEQISNSPVVKSMISAREKEYYRKDNLAKK